MYFYFYFIFIFNEHVLSQNVLLKINKIILIVVHPIAAVYLRYVPVACAVGATVQKASGVRGLPCQIKIPMEVDSPWWHPGGKIPR